MVKPREYQCEVCGKTFMQSRRDKVHCSKACAKIAYYRRRKEMDFKALPNELLESPGNLAVEYLQSCDTLAQLGRYLRRMFDENESIDLDQIDFGLWLLMNMLDIENALRLAKEAPPVKVTPNIERAQKRAQTGEFHTGALQRAIDYYREHYAERMTDAALAEMLGCSQMTTWRARRRYEAEQDAAR